MGRAVSARLNGREIGSESEHESANSARKSRLLDERAPVVTGRVVTDGRSVVDVAGEVPPATGWVNSR